MSSTAIQQKIEAWLGENLADPTHFLVRVSVALAKGPEARVEILVDSDTGITIDECAAYSRKLGAWLEEEALFAGPYNLEVASPGLDFPLSGERQFRKNIGRILQIDHVDGSRVEGRLEALEAEQIRLQVTEKGKGKKVLVREVVLPVNQIKKANVTVSFK